MRTPQKVINFAKNYFDDSQTIITEVDKKAYLSSLKLSNPEKVCKASTIPEKKVVKPTTGKE